MADNNRRQRQVTNAIREELVTIIRKDISDPRLEMAGMITISGVDLTEDMRNATVWVSFMGKEEKSKEVKGAMEALRSAEKFVHRLLIKRISMKVHPHLNFKFDHMFDRAAIASSALHEASAVEKETAAYRKEHGIDPEEAAISGQRLPRKTEEENEE
jgi:ribosome-binding factor A